MRQHAALILLIITAVILFGCVSQKEIAPKNAEVLTKTEEVDLDGDGAFDYAIYTFAPVKADNLQIQRRLFVAVQQEGSFSDFNVVDDPWGYAINDASKAFEEFVVEKEAAVNSCSNELGLIGVTCIEPKSCAKLCSSASSKCHNIASNHEIVLGDSVKSFVKSNNEMANEISLVRKDIENLKTASKDDKNKMAARVMDLISHISSINSGLITSHPSMTLCEHANYGADKLNKLLSVLGSYEKTPVNYEYMSVISVKVTGTVSKEQQSNTFIITDRLSAPGVNPDAISSPQLDTQNKMLSINSSGSITNLAWEAPNVYSQSETLLVYSFSSTSAPSSVSSTLKTPAVAVKSFDLFILIPTMFIFDFILTLSKSPIMALGLSLGITLVAVFFVYNLLSILFYIVSAITAGEKITTGIRRAVAKTHVQWKSDMILAIVLLAGGIAATVYSQTSSMKTSMTLFEAIDTLLLRTADYAALGGVLGIFFGLFVFYLAIDNAIKVSFLEVEYGRKIKEEKDIFSANASQLKTRLADLKALADTLSTEGVNVTHEYEVIEKYPIERIDTLSKKMDQYSKQTIEQMLFEVDGVLERLTEKKKSVHDNWQKWSALISNTIDQTNEIHQNALVGVPPALRIWALTKYLKEHSDEGIVLDGETLRRKFIQPDKIIKDLINKGYVTGGVLIKDGTVLSTTVDKGSSTVASVLALKLVNYTLSAVKKLGQHSYTSIAVVGDKLVLALLRYQTLETILFIKKDKFKEAVDEWKIKIKLIEK